METAIIIAILAVIQFPVVFLYGRHKERNKPAQIHFYGEVFAAFDASDLRAAKMFAKKNVDLMCVITHDTRVVWKGCAKKIHQFNFK